MDCGLPGCGDQWGVVAGGARRPCGSCFLLQSSSCPCQHSTISSTRDGGWGALCSAVVQVYAGDRNSWTKRCCGVACLVKDNSQRSYFIRVYDIKEGRSLFEQEFYTGFSIRCPKPYFITFAGDLEHPHTVPADGAVGVEVEGHQVFWMCDDKPTISVLTTVPPHTDSLGVSTKTKAGLVTEDDPLPF
ncbi:hypothetical protein NFI96_001607 [Prochilodus magdalenae]|nr:hypothetical protein NFI96_001607 [Prochilodus magdalenae]